ncbi:MAG TPA: hypothetical protein VNO31_40090 [Umezawaea sp.]|nr:hypothetical protein [Umezawaea sp.]
MRSLWTSSSMLVRRLVSGVRSSWAASLTSALGGPTRGLVRRR